MQVKKTAMLVYVPMIMDYVMKRDPQVATRLDTGDMDNEPKNEEKGKRSGVELTN